MESPTTQFEGTVSDFAKKFNLDTTVQGQDLGKSFSDFVNNFKIETPQTPPVTPEISANQVTQTDNGLQMPASTANGTELSSAIQSIIANPIQIDDSSALDLEKTILELSGELGGETAEGAQLEEELGVPNIQKQQRDIQTQLQQLQASLAQGLTDEAGRVIPIEAITGRQGLMTQQATNKALGLKAISSALDGQLQTANDAIERQLDLKYRPIENQIATLSQAYEFNRDRLNKKEERLANQRQEELSFLESRLQERKADESQARGIVLEQLAVGGMPSSIANNLLNDPNLSTGTLVKEAGQYLRDPVALLQQQKLRNDIAKQVSEMTGGIKTEKPPEPPSKAERDAYKFYERIEWANGKMGEIEDSLSKEEIGGLQNIMSVKIDENTTVDQIVRSVSSPKLKNYVQSVRVYTEARLREESGAAIPPSEFMNDLATYAMQFSDTPETLAQKREARALTVDGFAYSSGNAYWERNGQNPASAIDERKFEESIDAKPIGSTFQVGTKTYLKTKQNSFQEIENPRNVTSR